MTPRERAVIEAAKAWTHQYFVGEEGGFNNASARLADAVDALQSAPEPSADEIAQGICEALAREDVREAFVAVLDDEDEYWDGLYGSDRGVALSLIVKIIAKEGRGDG